MKAIRFCSGGGYMRWSWPWLKEWGWWAVRGWFSDARTYWHRARYGWAPRDTWSLDDYLDGVLGGALAHLVENNHSYPSEYPGGCEAWEADLRRWADAFTRKAADDLHEIHGNDYTAWNADEEARRVDRNKALAEMVLWWDALWD